MAYPEKTVLADGRVVGGIHPDLQKFLDKKRIKPTKYPP